MLNKICFIRVFGLILLVVNHFPYATAQTRDSSASKAVDSVAIIRDSIRMLNQKENYKVLRLNEVPMSYVDKNPYISVTQLLKGNVAGVYAQEPSGEPGTLTNIFVHGVGSPLLSQRELYDQQAVVFIDGIPQIKQNPFVYDVQKYDFNPIGTATDVLASFNPDNIESIEVIKDPIRLAALGPMASKGAIWIKTKGAEVKNVGTTVNSYFGIVTAPRVDVTNAAYENSFRKTFYNRFGDVEKLRNYPSFLRDSTNSDYYGPSNWTDLYYKATPIYSADASLTVGLEKATLRAFVSALKNANSADETSMRRYTGSIAMDVAPFKWLGFTAKIDYDWLSRNRNRSITDRLAEMRYIPDLSNPLSPNKTQYGAYLDAFSGAIDNNSNHVINGLLGINMKFGHLVYEGHIGLNYGEEYRDAFWPTILNEGNNFVSTFFGMTQRFQIANNLSYKLNLPNDNTLTLSGGQEYYKDQFKFNYAYAYNTPNDFIKIDVVDFDKTKADYLQSNSDKPYFYPSNMGTSLVSFRGNALWEVKKLIKVNLLVRRDGSSTMQIGQKWYTGYGGSFTWDLRESFFETQNRSLLSELYMTGGWSRLGKTFSDDRFSAGPQYRPDLGWGNEPTLGSYNGISGLTRPYNSGWIGYDIPWQYVDNLNVGVGVGIMDNRIRLLTELYNRDDKNGLFVMPIPAEYGYVGAYKSGLAVNNKGIDLSLQATILTPTPTTLGWVFNGNLNYNKNKLTALPGGVNEVVVGNNKFIVGKPIDQFWVYENVGTYNNASDIPQNLTYQGLPFQVGDAKWRDQNGDNIINDEDKVLKGNYMPKITGGFGSNFSYGAFNLDFQFYLALGRKILNQYASKRLDFINTEAANDIYSVKEITYWEKKVDLTRYPVYNPWSSVVPYREDQDLFLDNASFLKLRSVSLAFDFAKLKNIARKKIFDKAQIYVTGTNLFTITKFKGDDPELASYNGVYSGNGLRLPRSVIFGFKLAF
ncbi:MULTISPECIES: TonB-dependent receptor plug domain-containing protein [Chitinophagaceae]